ncbi:hypothetical protein LRR18_17100, partial [Mangrovimonas sp. AS39]|uniref:hypothetical protein n=1 Tax=Mangrovimonas futianensis TaxID=2895523 RepID=UPI001E411500
RKAKRLVNPFPLWLTSVFFEAKARAKRKNVACEITKNELEEIYNETKGFCAYCNTQFNFHNTTKTRRDSPSVDRIIPDQGYIKNNLTICCHRCNMIKNEATPTQLLAIANKVHDLATIRNLM